MLFVVCLQFVEVLIFQMTVWLSGGHAEGNLSCLPFFIGSYVFLFAFCAKPLMFYIFLCFLSFYYVLNFLFFFAKPFVFLILHLFVLTLKFQ